MASASPARPTRRAARRNVVVEEDSEDELSMVQEEPDQEFAPVPKRASPRKSTRRQTSAEAAPSPKKSTRTRRTRASEGIEPSQIFDAEETVPSIEPPSPTKKVASPRKWKSAAPTRSRRSSAVPSVTPAPQDDASEIGIQLEAPSTPLADITSKALNRPPPSATKVKPVQHVEPERVLEKPMDIVIRARSQVLPVVEEPTGPKSRMVIRQLVMTNFKSYAGRQTVGPFHASFSAVVGPNGSGKSNVIDSLLFVFGFRASKMRQGKISALIHSSANHPDLDFCEVEVHFQEIVDLPGGKHETPIEEAGVELENMNEVCIEKQGRVQHVEKERNALEDKKNKALTFIRDENELVEKQSTLYQIYIAECEDNAQVTEEAVEQMQAQLNAELEKHAGEEDGIHELEKAFKKGSKEFEAMTKATQELAKDNAKHDKESVKFDEKRKFIAGKQKKAEKTLSSSRFAASDAANSVEKHTDDIERKSKEVAELEASMHKEEQELAVIREGLKGKTQGFSDQIAAKQKSLEPWNEKVNQKQSQAAVLQSELDILLEKGKSGQKAIEEAQAKIESIQTQQSEKAAEIEQRQKEKARLEKDIRKHQDALQKLAASEPEVRSQVSSARQKAEEGRASLQTSQNQGNVLKGLLRLRDTGRIDGFHGRLGNLGTIDQQYDVAISTACPALENMVVDTVEAGQQCIEHLRKNNLGRANFILLDRLAQKDLSPIKTPENVPRLFDLIKAKDKKFGPAFYSIMRDTLVAENLEQANRIAYGAKRWRVVTLDGQLIDVSGTMSGGGTRVARGAMSSKLSSDTTKEQVQQYEAERDAIEQQFDAFLERQRDLENSLREKQEELPKVDTAIQKCNLDVSNLSRNLVDAEKRVQDLTAELNNTSADDAQIKSLEKQIANTRKEIDSLKAETAMVEGEIEALQNKIMEVGGLRLRSQKATVDGLKERIDLLNEDISTAEVGKTKNTKLHTKHEKARADAEKELETLATDLEKLEADVAAQATNTSDSKQRLQAAQDELSVKKDELAEIKSSLDKQTAQLNETRAAEIEMRNKLEENQKILGDNSKKNRYWKEKLSKLELHDIADLEVPVEAPAVPDENAMDVDQAEEGTTKAVEALGADADAMDVDGAPPTSPSQHDTSIQQSRRQLPIYTRDELEDKSKDHLVASIAALEEKVSNASGIDLDSAKNRLTDLRSMRLTQFMTGFTTISQHLKSMYQLITLGGNAELELVDSLDPFSEGILFSVMPPKKSWKNIGNLSGGEKTLSSLALVFALHVYRPTPLYVMDEIDAALDFRNVSIVAGYIKERTKNAQFIVISLRNNMFELAERLVGIYKVNHMTKSVTVENRDYLGMQREERLRAARAAQARALALQQQTQTQRPGTAGSLGSSQVPQQKTQQQSSQ
ncbi:Structural maintenance of chromosomes protein 4 [Cyphellophora attinorum]|uniref:Structural maintenance of chromosomes protein n=1 Tax=Cyphellophora attinorum TaxID=1664694 RepID=A0A0N0NR94_9EURO|nr:Structural maintenance of chromosomes protein 4 [Phialophora attinorum]KPI44569.1 Structural maintenance of chromosomes protein 4 [Phialophora attinorum]